MALQDSLEQIKSIDFDNLDVNNIGSWPGVVKVMLTTFLFLLVLGVGYYWHVTDKQNIAAATEDKIIFRIERGQG